MKSSSYRAIALRLSRLQPSTTTTTIVTVPWPPARTFSSALPDRIDTDDEDEEYPTVTRSAAASSGNYFYRSRRHKTPTRNVHPVFSTTDAHPHPTRKQPEEANMVVNNNNNAISPKIQECTCGYQKEQDLLKENAEPLPPPLPQPVYSVHKRVLPSNLTALSSPLGRQFLLESMAALTAESYWALTEQFVNQSDPAYCGVTTLLMVLNAMNIDPGVRWKGGWRFYGDEDVLLQRCCLNKERIRRVGITMEQFMILGTCHGTRITMKRPPPPAANDNNHYSDSMDTSSYSLQEFRKDLKETLDSQFNRENSMIVTSYSRAALQQTGDGHFSPIAAFHEPSDHVLILDVARFKYPPYWVSVKELYESMQPVDEATQLPRGWYVMTPPSNAVHHSYQMTDEDRRPAHLVPLAHEKEPCPLGEIKVQFCPAKAKAEKEAGVAPKELQ